MYVNNRQENELKKFGSKHATIVKPRDFDGYQNTLKSIFYPK